MQPRAGQSPALAVSPEVPPRRRRLPILLLECSVCIQLVVVTLRSIADFLRILVILAERLIGAPGESSESSRETSSSHRYYSVGFWVRGVFFRILSNAH
jgi:predicted cobalt transporter CbtA